MTHTEKALEIFWEKFNCSQAVFGAFAEELGLSFDQAMKVALCFSAGMRKGEVCGAVSGAMMLAGLLNSKPEEGGKSKAATYKASRDIPAKFIAKNGSAICKELKGVDTGEVLRSCPGCIEDAVELVHEVLGI